MAYTPVNQAQTPSGQLLNSKLSGVAFFTTDVLSANQSVDTGWLPCEGFPSLLYAFRSDQISAAGSIKVEYSMDGVSAVQGGLNRQYTDVNLLFQVSVAPKLKYVRLTYTNGATAQGNFLFTVQFSTSSIPPTSQSLFAKPTATNLALLTAAVLYLEDDGGDFGRLKRVSDALKVYIANPSSATDVSALAKESGGNLAAIFNKINSSLAVTGAFYQAIQPVSAAALPLPTGASTSANQTTANTSLNNIDLDLGASADAAVTNPSASASVIALLKGCLTMLNSLFAAEIGFSTTATQTTVNANTTGIQALAANANRKNAFITNTTSVSVSIYYGTLTTSRVATLTAIGQYWEMNPDLYKGVITVKSTSGTPLLEIVETTA